MSAATIRRHIQPYAAFAGNGMLFSKLITPGPCSLTLSESSGRARESNTGFASHRASAHSSRSFSIPCLKQRLFSNCLFICPSIFAPPITFNKALPSTRSYTPYTFLYACFQARSMQIPRILTRIHFSLYIISLPQCQVMNSKKTSTIQRKPSFMVSAYFVFDSFSCDTFNLGCKKAGDLFGSPAQ